MALGKFKLSKGCSERGADMGRPSTRPADLSINIKLRLFSLPLDSGGYDTGGAYWGIPSNLYLAMSTDEVEVEYGGASTSTTQWISGSGSTAIVKLYFRGANREEAKQEVIKILPNATFYRK